MVQHAVSDGAVKRPFDPQEAIQTECMITTFQNVYYYTENFSEAKEKLRQVVLVLFMTNGVLDRL